MNMRFFPGVRHVSQFGILAIVILLAAAACSGGEGSAGPAQAVEGYFEALIAKDADALVARSCADWEDDARLEYDSFAAITARLEEPACRESGQDGDERYVSCTGKIVANYNGEDQDLSLADRGYRVVQEGGEWRMCGYR